MLNLELVIPALLIGFFLIHQMRLRRPKTPLTEIRRLVNDERASLIDVRSQGEFSLGSIPGSRNVPLQQLPSAVSKFDRNKPIVVYCQSGARSSHAAKMLRSRGFQAVHDLGAISNWS
ncbi:MAG: hypothetical protein A2X94_11320 [Bdellovibrionales bacterium GWB1_55_8]|nr:MAG: hypothetical protein A2X94_11320 [Bdellovibrionales bacterium GWB1_55_8]